MIVPFQSRHTCQSLTSRELNRYVQRVRWSRYRERNSSKGETNYAAESTPNQRWVEVSDAGEVTFRK